MTDVPPTGASHRTRWARLAERPLTQLTLLRIREFIREPEALFWSLAFPILLAGGLGLAFRERPPEIAHVAVVSAELGARLGQASGIEVEVLSPDDALDALRTGRLPLVVEPDPGGGVVFRYDDLNPDARAARALVDQALQRAAGRADPVTVRDDTRREPGTRYIDFLIPGLIGMGIMGNSIFGLGFSIVDARRRKLMKRLIATPMRRHHYLLSFLLWRMGLLGVEIGVPIGFGVLVFGVPVRGHPAEIVLLSALGSLTFGALALLLASRARTIEAVSGLMNVVMLPMWILSGVFFSADRFPDAIQPVIALLPLTALISALRTNMLQATRLVELGPEMAILVGWMVVCFGLAFKLFRWR